MHAAIGRARLMPSGKLAETCRVDAGDRIGITGLARE
jgi:hypothetical protein